MERSVTITGISFGLQRGTSDDQCHPQATLTLDFPSPSSWGSPSQPTDSASLPTAKVVSSEVCLSMTELQTLAEYCARWVPRFGFALLDHIYAWTTSIQTHDTGFDGMAFSMTPSCGESTSIVTWYGRLGLIGWLQSWMTSLRWPNRPDHWESEISTCATSLTIHMSIPDASPDVLALLFGSEAVARLSSTSAMTSEDGRQNGIEHRN